MRLIGLAQRLQGALDRWLNPGPWQYAGCCGCGMTVVNYQLVARDEDDAPKPYEQYCRPCWNTKPVLWPLEHVEFSTPLIRVPNREADRIFADLVSRRAA